MKANEAPEKIYLFENPVSGTPDDRWLSKRSDDEEYANGKKVYLWGIGKVKVLQDLERGSLFVDKNPQQFAYCPLSYGESY